MSSISDKDTKSITDYRHKHPVFDGETPSAFKDWWDNAFATLEMEDIEEHVTDAWKDKDMPSKSHIEPPVDTTDTLEIAEDSKLSRQRKEMNKAKDHMVSIKNGGSM